MVIAVFFFIVIRVIILVPWVLGGVERAPIILAFQPESIRSLKIFGAKASANISLSLYHTRVFI